MKDFMWLQTASQKRRKSDSQKRNDMVVKELADRAGLYYRLGYPPSRAIARLKNNLSWDFQGPTGSIIAEKEIAELVKRTYFRRPTR